MSARHLAGLVQPFGCGSAASPLRSRGKPSFSRRTRRPCWSGCPRGSDLDRNRRSGVVPHRMFTDVRFGENHKMPWHCADVGLVATGLRARAFYRLRKHLARPRKGVARWFCDNSDHSCHIAAHEGEPPWQRRHGTDRTNAVSWVARCRGPGVVSHRGSLTCDSVLPQDAVGPPGPTNHNMLWFGGWYRIPDSR
jgi:hypothetical protein